MCGIAGTWCRGGPVDPQALDRMSAALGHRGPDGSGTYVSGNVGFAHRRLAIIDPTGSPQPMSDASGQLHVTFNGEILNYRQLRTSIDFPYRTAGDTETLLAVFRDQGPTGAARLIGQFAYAIYDERADELFLFRDRLGVLPLHYCTTPEGFWFASEIKALIAGMGQTPAVDTAQLSRYLQHRFTPAPGTLFDGIRKLPPGHFLRVTRDGVDAPVSYVSDEAAGPPMSDSAALSSLGQALDMAVRRNLVADVPVGAFLSGGLDSSLLVRLATSARPDDRLLTFSAGFDDPRWNELPHARRVAEHLGTEHHEITVGPTDFDTWLPPLTWHRDAPISEPSDIPIHLLARLAREHVKVALSGEGADELFGGYPKYRLAGVTRSAGVVPAGVRSTVGRLVEHRLPAKRWRMRTAVRALAADKEHSRYTNWFASFTEPEAEALLRDNADRSQLGHSRQGAAIRRMMAWDTAYWLPDNLLERADRMAMATSLETRPPYLDPEVFAVARRLLPRQLVRRQRTKWLLKEFARQQLPDGIADRAKVGFRVPVGEWFRGHMRQSTRDRLLDPGAFVATVLDRSLVKQLLDRHDQGLTDEGNRIWSLLALEVWHDTFYRSSPAPVAG